MNLTIGQYLHELRINHQLTLTQLGAKLGIDSGALSKIEHGKKRLSQKHLPIIAEVFSLNLQSLKNEFVSENIAHDILSQDCDAEVLQLAQAKIRIFKDKFVKQAQLDL